MSKTCNSHKACLEEQDRWRFTVELHRMHHTEVKPSLIQDLPASLPHTEETTKKHPSKTRIARPKTKHPTIMKLKRTWSNSGLCRAHQFVTLNNITTFYLSNLWAYKYTMPQIYLKLRLKWESIPYSIFLEDLHRLSIQKKKQLPTRAVVSY